MPELSNKPYLLRAIYDWCVDSGCTPYLSVTVDSATRVPMEYVKDGQIVLNIGPIAVERFKMGNDLIEFSARFNGTGRELSIPIGAVSAIYARENGQGLSFEGATTPRGSKAVRLSRTDNGAAAAAGQQLVNKPVTD